MGRAKIDKTGEERLNNFGSKMIITNYRNYKDIDVYFPEYNWTLKHARYGDFKKGNIKCPYEPRVFGIGCIGEGKYKASENGKNTKYYDYWNSMLRRCYGRKQNRDGAYEGCVVKSNWHNFQNFAEWLDNHYYEVPNQKMCLDKDILHKGNKIYSDETCCFVPEKINTLLIKCDKSRGNCPIGVTYHKRDKIYEVNCNRGHKQNVYLGRYNTPEEAFQVYKSYKEQVIKDTIDSYEGIIPEPHYSKLKEAMYNYKVEITD